MAVTKLGAQGWLIGNGADAFRRFCETARPAVIKILDFHAAPVEALRSIRKRANRSFIVFRAVEHSHRANPFADNPEAEAERWYSALRPALLERRGLFDAFETLNEIVPWDAESARRFIRFEEKVCQLAAADGFRVVICNFSTGTPETHLFDLFRSWRPPSNAILGPHEYAWERNPAWTWHMLRYQRWAPPGVPVLIGETGNEPGGWRGRMDAGAFLSLMAAYDAAISADSRVLGAAIFVFNDAFGGWGNYAVQDIEGDLARYLSARLIAYPVLNPIPKVEEEGMCEKYVVVARALNLRDAPSLNGRVIHVMRRGETVMKIANGPNPWVMVVHGPTGKTGWCHSGYLGKAQ